jgi:hypothetical protein
MGLNQVIMSALQTTMLGPLLVQHMIMNPSISQSLKGVGVAEIILTGA